MSFIGNLLWIILGGGIITCLEYLLAGVVLCITIIGIPFGLQCFKLAHVALIPFGRVFEDAPKASGCVAVVMNVLWLVTAGAAIALTHLGLALVCAVTIIGIPFAVQHVKLAVLAIWPFGKIIH